MIARTISAEWVDNCITYADEKQSMKFDSLMKWILNSDKAADWAQRRAGLTKKDKAPRSASQVITDPEELRRRMLGL